MSGSGGFAYSEQVGSLTDAQKCQSVQVYNLGRLACHLNIILLSYHSIITLYLSAATSQSKLIGHQHPTHITMKFLALLGLTALVTLAQGCGVRLDNCGYSNIGEYACACNSGELVRTISSLSYLEYPKLITIVMSAAMPRAKLWGHSNLAGDSQLSSATWWWPAMCQRRLHFLIDMKDWKPASSRMAMTVKVGGCS